MKTRHRIQKAEEAAATVDDDATQAATHRLTGITVKEVSVVDRAANKRKYLLVKEDDAKKAAPPPAAPAATPPPPAPPTGPTPETLRISPELKTQVMGALQDAQSKIGVITKVLEGSSETPGAPPPQELMDALQQLASMFLSPDATPPVTPPAVPPPAATTKTEGAQGEPVPAAKAGRKLSAARLAQLQTARDTLAALIDDVSEAAAEGGAEQPAGEDAPAAEKSTKAAQPAAPAVDAQVIALRGEVQQMAASMAESMKKMSTVFEAQNQRIADLAKSHGVSAQADLDTTPAAKPAKVVWDLDMAAKPKTFQ